MDTMTGSGPEPAKIPAGHDGVDKRLFAVRRPWTSTFVLLPSSLCGCGNPSNVSELFLCLQGGEGNFSLRPLGEKQTRTAEGAKCRASAPNGGLLDPPHPRYLLKRYYLCPIIFLLWKRTGLLWGLGPKMLTGSKEPY